MAAKICRLMEVDGALVILLESNGGFPGTHHRCYMFYKLIFMEFVMKLANV